MTLNDLINTANLHDRADRLMVADALDDARKHEQAERLRDCLWAFLDEGILVFVEDEKSIDRQTAAAILLGNNYRFTVRQLANRPLPHTWHLIDDDSGDWIIVDGENPLPVDMKKKATNPFSSIVIVDRHKERKWITGGLYSIEDARKWVHDHSSHLTESDAVAVHVYFGVEDAPSTTFRLVDGIWTEVHP